MKEISTGAIIAIAVTGLFLTVLTTGLVTTQQTTLDPEGETKTVPAAGTLSSVNVGVYVNEDCLQNCTSIDWGNLSPGGSTTRTIYVRNTGKFDVVLSLSTAGWMPPDASAYFTLSWNRADFVLNPDTSVLATLTLVVSPSVENITSFSFNVVITGTG